MGSWNAGRRVGRVSKGGSTMAQESWVEGDAVVGRKGKGREEGVEGIVMDQQVAFA